MFDASWLRGFVALRRCAQVNDMRRLIDILWGDPRGGGGLGIRECQWLEIYEGRFGWLNGGYTMVK